MRIGGNLDDIIVTSGGDGNDNRVTLSNNFRGIIPSHEASGFSSEPTTFAEAVAAATFDERVRSRAWAVAQIHSKALGSADIGRETLEELRKAAQAAGDTRYSNFDATKEKQRQQLAAKNRAGGK